MMPQRRTSVESLGAMEMAMESLWTSNLIPRLCTNALLETFAAFVGNDSVFISEPKGNAERCFASGILSTPWTGLQNRWPTQMLNPAAARRTWRSFETP